MTEPAKEMWQGVDISSMTTEEKAFFRKYVGSLKIPNYSDLLSKAAAYDEMIRLKNDLAKAIFYEGGGPEKPAMCDLVAYVEGNARKAAAYDRLLQENEALRRKAAFADEIADFIRSHRGERPVSVYWLKNKVTEFDSLKEGK